MVSVHLNTQTSENVQQFAATQDMNFPIVVDNQAGDITDQFKSVGVTGYPAYILLDPDGKIVANDALFNEGPSLRRFKLEIIHQVLNR